jgi:hypothetical protein
MFVGNGSGLTNVGGFPTVFHSSNNAGGALTANVEKEIIYSTITLASGSDKVIVWAYVHFLYAASAANTTSTIRVSNAGGSCTNASTALWSTLVGVPSSSPHTEGAAMTALHIPPSPGTYTYCLTIVSNVAITYFDRVLTVMEVGPNSTSTRQP